MSNNVTYQKPDVIDGSVTVSPTTPTTNSPITAVSTRFEKPNAYDEEPAKVVTASRHGSRSSRMTVDSFASRYVQRYSKESSIYTASSSTDQDVYSSPNTPVESPPLSPKPLRRPYSSFLDKHITSSILSLSTPTTQTTFPDLQEKLLKDAPNYVLPSSPANSIAETIAPEDVTNVAAATAALLSNDSGIVSSFFLQQTKKRSAGHNNVIVYNFRKASLLKPSQHEIYADDMVAFRKIQPHTSWGFQSMLYRNRNDGQGIKVAEARRRAFQRDISIEAADYDHSVVDDITQSYIPTLRSTATHNIYCQDLVKRSQSNILFEYETWFHGSRMRWKRPSLLSHDFTCEIKLTRPERKIQLQQQLNKKRSFRKMKDIKQDGFIDSDSDDDDDDHDHHSHKTCRRWKLIAEFSSHKMSYLSKDLGKLSIDLELLEQVERDRCDLLEANIVMTSCTLIDLIRDIMGK